MAYYLGGMNPEGMFRLPYHYFCTDPPGSVMLTRDSKLTQ